MYKCRNCIYIRYFLISVFILIIMALIFTDKLKYLSFINPEKFAYCVLFMGITLFIIKILKYYYKKLSIFNKPDKVRNMPRKPSKSMSSKKIN